MEALKTPGQPSLTQAISGRLFSGGQVSAQRRQAKYQYHAARETYSATQAEVSKQTEALVLATNNLIERLATKQRAIESNSRVLDLVQKGYHAGLSDISVLLDAQKAVFTAQRNYQQDKYRYILNWLRLKQLAGTVSEKDLASLNQYLSNI